jgi:tetrahydrodipicolinate N-succinyltransferase
VWLGGGVIVCPGVKIGDGVIAAAGAVITVSSHVKNVYSLNFKDWLMKSTKTLSWKAN